MMIFGRRYSVDFILNSGNTTREGIEDSLSGLGDELVISQASSAERQDSTDYNIRIITQDPTLIFDVCSQFGRLKSVKIGEVT